MLVVLSYSETALQLQDPRNHVFLEDIAFSLPNSSLFLSKIYFFKQILRVNTYSSNYSPLFATKKKPKFKRNKKNLESKLKLNVCVTLTSRSSYNKAQPSIGKTLSIICSLDLSRPSSKQTSLFYIFFEHSNTAYSNTSYLHTEFEESMSDCISP